MTEQDAGRKAGLHQAAGRTQAAIAILEPQLADHERTFGAEHPNTLASRYNLANAYQDAGRTRDAIALLEPLLADLERILGAEHPNTLLTRGNLAERLPRRRPHPGRDRDLRAAARRPRADPRRRAPRHARHPRQPRQRLRRRRPHATTRSRSSSRCSTDLERVLGAAAPQHARAPAATSPTPTRPPGARSDAIAIFEPLLARHERTLGAEHPNTLLARNNLANAYRDAGRARRTRSRSSSRCSPTATGRSAPSTPTRSTRAATSPTPTRPPGARRTRSRSSSRCSPTASGCSAPSIPTRSRAAATSPTPTRPPGARRTRSRSSSRCGADLERDPRRRASRHAREPRQPRQRLPGRRPREGRDRDPRAAAAPTSSGSSAPSIPTRSRAAATSPTPTRPPGAPSDAIAIFEPLLADRERILGAEHPDTLVEPRQPRQRLPGRRAHRRRDRDLRAAGRRLRADPRRRAPRHAQRARQPRQRLPGRRPRRRRDRAPRAAARRLRADARRRRTPTTLLTRNTLANAYQDAGRTDDAIAILEPLLADRERLLGAEHPNTLRTRNNLAIVYQDAGRTDDAIAILEPLVGDLERILGAEPSRHASARATTSPTPTRPRGAPRTPTACRAASATGTPVRAAAAGPALFDVDGDRADRAARDQCAL